MLDSRFQYNAYRRSEPLPGCSTSSILEKRTTFERPVDSELLGHRNQAHKKRLKKLRKELDYIADTAWMYPSIDNIVGQS